MDELSKGGRISSHGHRLNTQWNAAQNLQAPSALGTTTAAAAAPVAVAS
jgi:hypothetical protein